VGDFFLILTRGFARQIGTPDFAQIVHDKAAAGDDLASVGAISSMPNEFGAMPRLA
jgi:hypothetical protein